MLNILKKIGSVIALFFLLCSTFISTKVIAEDSTQIGTATVTAAVLGSKPIVTLVAPTSATNSGSVVITKIVGHNFTGAYGVALDDLASTVLSGTITITDDCDSAGDNCGGGGIYQKITGLSIPAGVNSGVYNVLVTTAAGTNLLSDTKITVNAAAPSATPSITNIAPSYVSAMADLNDMVTLNFTIKDSDSANVNFDGDSNVLVAGASVDNHLPVSQQTSGANGVDGETVSFRFNSNSVAEQFGTLDIRVGDGGSPAAGNTDTATVNVFIEPSW